MYRKIVAPLDGSEYAECSLEHAKAIARGCQVPEVILLRVVEPINASDITTYVEAGIDTVVLMREIETSAREYIDRMTAALQKEGLSARGVVIAGWAADTILKYCEEEQADLIVMSTHGRSGISRWFMGSVADKVVRHSGVPVLLISPAGCKMRQPTS